MDKFFQVSKRGSSLKTEILAGISTFLSLSYILVVNPSILSQAGFDKSSVFFATAIASGLATILMGLWARLPFALAPGLEMNGFVAFVAIGQIGMSVSQSLGAVFWSGVLCLILSVLPVRERIINAIPKNLQLNLAISVGVFVATIGLFITKIIFFEKGVFKNFGNFFSTEAIALYLGLLLCVILRKYFKESDENFFKRIAASSSFLFAIFGATIFYNFFGNPEKVADISNATTSIFTLDLFPFAHPSFLVVFLVLFLIDFYGSIGKFIGLTASTNLVDKEGKLPGMKEAIAVDGIGTIGGALLGTTSIITYVESAIGISAGGRTGIVAIVCGLLMCVSVFFSPIISLVPVVATSGVLVYVSYALIPKKEERRDFLRFDLIIGLVMGILSFFTFSLDKAMLFGFLAYVGRQAVSKDEKINPYLFGSTVLLLLSLVIQFFIKGNL